MKTGILCVTAALLLPLCGCQPVDYPPFGPAVDLQPTYPSNELTVSFGDKHMLYSYGPHEFRVEEIAVLADGARPVKVQPSRDTFRFTAPPEARTLALTAIVNDWNHRFRVRIDFTNVPSANAFAWKSGKPDIQELPPSPAVRKDLQRGIDSLGSPR